VSELTGIDKVLPENVEDLKRIFEVKRERGIVYDPDGGRSWEDKVLVRIFAKFQESGWLARLSASELKVLISLALRTDENVSSISLVDCSIESVHSRHSVLISSNPQCVPFANSAANQAVSCTPMS